MAHPMAVSRRRYRFGPFVLSPSRRVLLRGTQELALIPRYFDLLLLLVERRGEAVHKREIFDAVWQDVVVSDSALTQAVRILRRTLSDDPREPVYIRTLSRHGYRFVFEGVLEETDDDEPSSPPVVEPPAPAVESGAETMEACLQRLLTATDETTSREAAERLHQAGTAQALACLDGRPGHARARAYLRDTRWDVPGAGPVPLLGQPGALHAFAVLAGLRLRRAGRLVESRWLTAAAGGAVAGWLAGLSGGAVLCLLPGSQMTATVPVVLGLLGMAAGGLGASGVGAGLALGEAAVRSWRPLALALAGGLGGGSVGAAAHLVGQWTVESLFGRDLTPVGGGFEGLVIGTAVGLGYALATPRPEGGMATPRGGERVRVALITGLFGAVAAAALAIAGSHLGAMSVDFMARSFPGSRLSFDPLAHLLGEGTPQLRTRLCISGGEGLVFGFGLAWGLTRRPHVAVTAPRTDLE